MNPLPPLLVPLVAVRVLSGIVSDPDSAYVEYGWDAVRFGCSLASVGDLDGDGAGELAIGSPSENPNGAVWIVSPLRQRVVGRISDGLGLRGLGYRVSRVGDCNGDGIRDLAVTGMFGHGQRLLAPMSSVVVVSVPGGERLASHHGHCADGAGDLDGDGCDEWIVGDVRWRGGRGAAYLISGATREEFGSWEGREPSSGCGLSVGGGVDFDSDGVPDLAILDGRTPPSGSAARVRLLSGADHSTIEEWGDAPWGTVTGGLELALLTSTSKPRVAVARADERGDEVALLRVGQSARRVSCDGIANDWLGSCLAVIGDVDGDGTADLLVGARRGGPYQGHARAISGADGASIYEIEPGEYTWWLGWAVSALDDVDGDGVEDFALSSCPWGTQEQAGCVRVHSGASGLELTRFTLYDVQRWTE